MIYLEYVNGFLQFFIEFDPGDGLFWRNFFNGD